MDKLNTEATMNTRIVCMRNAAGSLAWLFWFGSVWPWFVQTVRNGFRVIPMIVKQ